jgi:hypothetical protein
VKYLFRADAIKSCTGCENGWKIHKGKCYFVSTDQKTWNEAAKFCKMSQSTLLTSSSNVYVDFAREIYQKLDLKEHSYLV